MGRYVILQEIGAGAMGRVYAAYDPTLDRKVAIKVLATHRADDADSIVRLLREAKSLARLTHPNVVTIHDVGDLSGQVFLAMEFIEGATVRDWLAASSRTWSDVVTIYRAAGAGLCAAHGAGLVHRDFKPDNVMVAADGRVLVMDFGLARQTRPVDCASTGDAETRDSEDGNAELTTAGDLVGTPAYMSPEQFGQGSIGPASDQFSFCVSLYEGLFGARPFSASSLADLASLVREGRRDPLPTRVGLPRWLLDAVLRGLEVEPGLRHASMRDLVTALDGGRRRGRRAVYLGAVGGLLVVATGAVIMATTERRKCRAGQDQIETIWNAERANVIAEAYAKVERPHAEQTWALASSDLDRFASAWSDGYFEACAATRIEGTQSVERLDQRLDCLFVQREQLRTLLDEFEQADVALVERTMAATEALPAPTSCADPKQLFDAETDPRRRALALDARSAFAGATAQHAAGRDASAIEAARRGLALVQEHRMFRIEAQLHQILGRSLDASGEIESSERAVRAGLEAASRSGDARLTARLWLDLVRTVGLSGDRPQEAIAIAEAARIAALTVEDDPTVQRVHADTRGLLLRELGNLEEAEAMHREAVALARAADVGAYVRAVVLNNLGNTLYERGEFREAAETLKEALEEMEEARGEFHPLTAQGHNNVGRACAALGDTDCARRYSARALELLAATYGEDHPTYADALFNRSVRELDAGHIDESEAKARRAIEIWVAHGGRESERVANGYGHLGNIARTRGDPESAVQHHQAAEDIYRGVYGADHPVLAMAMTNRANALIDLDRDAEALSVLQRALEIREANLGPEHPALAFTLLGQVNALLSMGRASEAVPLAERALALRESKVESRPLVAYAYFAVARARWDADADRVRAVELAQRSHRTYANDDDADPADLDEVRRWLDARGISGPLPTERQD